MNIPTLPTDSIYKFLFFAGLLSMFYSVSFPLKDYYETNSKIIVQRGELKKRSEALKIHANRIELLKSENQLIQEQYRILEGKWKQGTLTENDLKLFEEKRVQLANNTLAMFKESEENVSKTIDLEIQTELIDDELEKLKNTTSTLWFTMIFGSILLFLGLFQWVKFQKFNDEILMKQYDDVLSAREICQSCGLELKYDDNKTVKKYCSFCYSNGNFRHPEITLSKFKILVSDRLKERSFNFWERFIYLKKLRSLDRWKKTLKWY